MTKARSNAVANAAKGDLTVGNGTNLSGILAVGSNGDTLVADSSTSTGLRYQGSMAAGKNGVLNGAMNIWQRGTSLSVAYNYTADRWKCYQVATAATASRSTDTTAGFQYSMKMQRNSGATSTGQVILTQSFESAISYPFQGKTVSFSFYAKAGANYSSASSALTVRLSSSTGTDQDILASWAGLVDVVNTTATLTTSWQRFTYTGSVPSNATQLGIEIKYTPVGTAGADDSFFITGIQVEIGSVATNFTAAGGTIQGELAACQRYYYRYTAEGAFAYIAPNGVAATTTIARAFLPLPVTQRVGTITLETNIIGMRQISNDTLYSSGTFTLDSSQSNLAAIKYTHGSSVFTAGNVCVLTANNSTSAYVGVSAEL